MQLEYPLLKEIWFVKSKFQSHIGAIRIILMETWKKLLAEFQSHIGAIRIVSIVRETTAALAFQSHVGAIRIR